MPTYCQLTGPGRPGCPPLPPTWRTGREGRFVTTSTRRGWFGRVRRGRDEGGQR